MQSLINILQRYNGFIFDLTQFALGSVVFYFLGLRLQSTVGIVEGRISAGSDIITFAVLIVAVIAQPVGAFFLKDAIQNSFNDKSRQALGSPGFFFFIMVVVLHVAFFGMLISDLIMDLGFDYVSFFEESSIFGNIIVGGILFVACVLPTFLTCIIIFPSEKNPSPDRSIIKTLLGDFIISFSAFVFISVYWDNLLGLVAGELSNESFGLKTVVVILFYFLFLMIYLPPRLVFLVTDYNRWFTWLRIFIVYIPFISAAY